MLNRQKVWVVMAVLVVIWAKIMVMLILMKIRKTRMINWLKRKFQRWFIPNGLLSYSDLCVLAELGVINAPLDHINGTSIDVILDKFICVENLTGSMDKVDL